MAQCKWFSCCPLRRLERDGVIDNSWRTRYCESDQSGCVRYRMEEAGESHPDNLLPDGSYSE